MSGRPSENSHATHKLQINFLYICIYIILNKL